MLTPAVKDLPRPRNKELIVSQKKPPCRMIATLRTIFFLRHNRAARKSQLKMQATHAQIRGRVNATRTNAD
jgi:hypothetical protein